MKSRKILISIFTIFFVLISCSTTDCISDKEMNNDNTVYIELNLDVHGKEKNTLTQKIQEINPIVRKSAKAKDEKNRLTQAQNYLKEVDNAIREKATTEIPVILNDILVKAGYEVIDTMNARYILNCDVSFEHSKTGNQALLDYDITISCSDTKNVNLDTLQGVTLPKYDSKLDNATYLTEGNYRKDKSWNANGRYIDKTEISSFDNILKKINKAAKQSLLDIM